MTKKNMYQPQANRFDTYGRENWNELRERAKTFLKEHPKQKYYRITGDTPNILLWAVDENDKSTGMAYIPFTDEEVRRIKQLVLNLYNQTADHPAHSFEELKIDNYMTFRGKDKELDALLFERADMEDIDLEHIALDTPLKFYLFSTYDYDMEKQALGEAERGKVCLTDEQYLYLLTEQLYDSDFSFNYLLRYNAPFAQKLLDIISGGMHAPSLIAWDEIYADAEHIRKEFPASESLCWDKTEDRTIGINIRTNDKHEMSVEWTEYIGVDTPDFDVNRKWTEGIDGKAVRMLFGGNSDKEMCQHIKERFHGPTAYDDLLAYLKENNVIFK